MTHEKPEHPLERYGWCMSLARKRKPKTGERYDYDEISLSLSGHTKTLHEATEELTHAQATLENKLRQAANITGDTTTAATTTTTATEVPPTTDSEDAKKQQPCARIKKAAEIIEKRGLCE